jgi:hypothetical protein
MTGRLQNGLGRPFDRRQVALFPPVPGGHHFGLGAERLLLLLGLRFQQGIPFQPNHLTGLKQGNFQGIANRTPVFRKLCIVAQHADGHHVGNALSEGFIRYRIVFSGKWRVGIRIPLDVLSPHPK